MFIQSYNQCTCIAFWDWLKSKSQEYILKQTPLIAKINANKLEAYNMDSWILALKGKRILIVHAFENTIKKQIPNLKNIYPNMNLFEGCTFSFVKPPVTLAGNHGGIDWKEHFYKCTQQIDDIKDFDVALVSAGGYGMLLCNYIFTQKKKQVMYIGGVLQIYFGILGGRWMKCPKIAKFKNDYWVRPEERPNNFFRVEKGCYW